MGYNIFRQVFLRAKQEPALHLFGGICASAAVLKQKGRLQSMRVKKNPESAGKLCRKCGDAVEDWEQPGGSLTAGRKVRDGNPLGHFLFSLE